MSATSPDDFFDSLGVYLTLERAQRLYGFDAQRYGLDDGEAANIAAVFGRVGCRAAGLGWWCRAAELGWWYGARHHTL